MRSCSYNVVSYSSDRRALAHNIVIALTHRYHHPVVANDLFICALDIDCLHTHARTYMYVSSASALCGPRPIYVALQRQGTVDITMFVWNSARTCSLRWKRARHRHHTVDVYQARVRNLDGFARNPQDGGGNLGCSLHNIGEASVRHGRPLFSIAQQDDATVQDWHNLVRTPSKQASQRASKTAPAHTNQAINQSIRNEWGSTNEMDGWAHPRPTAKSS